MALFSDIHTALGVLRELVGEDIEATGLPALVHRLPDEALVSLIENATVMVRVGESMRIAATGVVAARSSRDTGHGGLAQKRGHRSAVSLIQDLTGSSRADATKQVRLGEALAAGLSEQAAVNAADSPETAESTAAT